MNRERFQQIKSLLRFDDILRRNKNDVLAPIREIFEQFTSRCRIFYVPSPFLTIDKQREGQISPIYSVQARENWNKGLLDL